jgi:chorismate mutase
MKLKQLREEIDIIDTKIISLIVRRLQIAKNIGVLKNREGLLIRNPYRENQKISNVVKSAASLGLSKQFIKYLFKLIIKESIKVQKETG